MEWMNAYIKKRNVIIEHALVSELSFFFRDEYFRMKLQWKSVSEEQEKRNSRLRDYRSLIGKFRFRNIANCTNSHTLTIQCEVEKMQPSE